MSRELNITLPIYFGVRKKYMIGMNWYSTAHYRARNKVKQEFHKMVGKVVSNNKIKSPFKTHYKLYYKNRICDACNIVAVIDKFLLDALQEYEVIDEDNVQHYLASSWEVVEQDKENPRIEVCVEEL